MLPRRLLALGAAFVVIATIAAACSEDLSNIAMAPDTGAPLGSLGESVCPDAAPAHGEVCTLPEGTACAFGPCGSPIAQCTFGEWRYSGNPQARPPCPKDFPVSDSPCPPCWPSGLSCTYGSSDCSAADASANTTVASCPDGRWTLASFPCAALDGGSDSGSDVDLDAGADVQGDAELDAD